MAKKGKRHHVILQSTESGHSYHTTKNKDIFYWLPFQKNDLIKLK